VLSESFRVRQRLGNHYYYYLMDIINYINQEINFLAIGLLSCPYPVAVQNVSSLFLKSLTDWALITYRGKEFH